MRFLDRRTRCSPTSALGIKVVVALNIKFIIPCKRMQVVAPLSERTTSAKFAVLSAAEVLHVVELLYVLATQYNRTPMVSSAQREISALSQTHNDRLDRRPVLLEPEKPPVSGSSVSRP